jgi:hypothetical protein
MVSTKLFGLRFVAENDEDRECRRMSRTFAGILVLLSTAALARDRIAGIEFYGYKGIDTKTVRKALPFREGDAYSIDMKSQTRETVKRITGRDVTDVEAICCDENGDRVPFIGLPGESTKNFDYNPAPKGRIRLSEEIIALHRQMESAEEAAIRKGGNAAKEDDSNGYALINDQVARSLQLKVRKYALKHEDEIQTVLASSSDSGRRAIAAEVLGYARQSRKQIAALVRASRDPSDAVRNNATRALGVLGSSNAELVRQIPPKTFVDMVCSGIWTDRNKASFLLNNLTRTRDKKLLAQLRAEALDALIEMAEWRDTGHALMARIVLGRIAGIPEARLTEIAMGPVHVILDALRRP